MFRSASSLRSTPLSVLSLRFLAETHPPVCDHSQVGHINLTPKNRPSPSQLMEEARRGRRCPLSKVSSRGSRGAGCWWTPNCRKKKGVGASMLCLVYNFYVDPPPLPPLGSAAGSGYLQQARLKLSKRDFGTFYYNWLIIYFNVNPLANLIVLIFLLVECWGFTMCTMTCWSTIKEKGCSESRRPRFPIHV